MPLPPLAGKLVLASHNPGKLKEIAELVEPLGLAVAGAMELDLPEPEETGESFIANAVLKAEAAARATGLVALADDSGFGLAALGGRPGIHSARYAGPERDFADAARRLNEELGANPDRRAFFVSALALAWPDGHVESFEGRVEGVMVWPPRGSRGFGYDPVFQANGEQLTFGEMEPARKHAISHRARAFEKLLAALKAA